ncbi:MAG: polysaccharide biosynthesis/export family protein, partial [Candidatus Cloacimonetes bacterium]|nr:polysaccharide biosynthesis/export family protein [Candidatus Cloacimonadota bacterium]
MKIINFLLLLLILVGCSKNKLMDEKTISAIPQYLEEIQVGQQEDFEIIKELQELQNIETDIYQISSGDRFNVYLYDESELDTEGVIVKPDGTISFKLIGEVYVEGLTVSEATKLMEEKLAEYIHYPKVSMIPYELTGANVTIVGKVVNSGVFEIKGDMRIVDAIAVAGGLSSGIFQNNTIELADLERSYIIRNNKILPVSFKELIREGNMLHNIPLIDGDYIYIPSSVNREVYVLGAVGTPWHFLYKESMTLMQVITFARGLTDNARDEVIIVRGGLSHPRVFRINLSRILAGEEHDFPLKPNDIIYVSNTPIAS